MKWLGYIGELVLYLVVIWAIVETVCSMSEAYRAAQDDDDRDPFDPFDPQDWL
jgi:hypothetical protein